MKRTICLLFLAFTYSLAQKQLIDTYEQALSKFSSKFYKGVVDDAKESENVLISPFSVHAVLSMVYQGSDGSSKKVLASALSPISAKEPQDLAKRYRSVIQQLNTIQNVTLKTANKVYVENNVQLQRSFDNVIKSDFLSQVEQLNFKDSPGSIKIINKWVEDQTNDKIKNLLSTSDVNENTRLVLVNAIYFKGAWNLKFDSKNTKTEPFYNGGLESGKKDVEIMHVSDDFLFSNLAPEIDARMIILPYKNNDVNMIVILPNKRDGLKEVEKKLIAHPDLLYLLNSADPRSVKLGLPKFKIETRVDLIEPLKKVGLDIIFDQEKANFSRILNNDDQLYVNKAVQKTFLEVNEGGSEAAEATFLAVLVPMSSNNEPPEVLQVDHPFIFFIVADADSGSQAESRILFQGRVTSL